MRRAARRRLGALLALALLGTRVVAAESFDPMQGDRIFGALCAGCHAQAQGRAPGIASLAARSPEEIVTALRVGSMRSQGEALSLFAMQAIAIYLTGRSPNPLETLPPARNPCGDTGANTLARQNARAADWSGWSPEPTNARYQRRAGLRAEDVPRLRLRWAYGLPGSMVYGQPAVVGGRLYVGSTAGRVFALDARSGCTYWTFDAAAPARTAVSVGALPRDRGREGASAAAYFGDDAANVYALDARTGALIWRRRVDTHPSARITGAPTLAGGRLYVPVASLEEVAAGSPRYACCTFRGKVLALEAASGRILWSSALLPAALPYGMSDAGTPLYGPAGAAVWSAPTVDLARRRIYVATGNSYTNVPAATADAIVALDLGDGAVRWVRQLTADDNSIFGCVAPAAGCPAGMRCLAPGEANCPRVVGPDVDFGASAILQRLARGRRVLLASQKSGWVYGLDPDHEGRVLWSTRVGAGGPLGGIEWGAAADARRLYVPVSDAFASAPGEHPGGLTALDPASGAKLWHTGAPPALCPWGPANCSAAQSQAVTAIPGIVFSGSVDGTLRAYDAGDGRIVWSENTARRFVAVNGVPTEGGSLDDGGVVVVDGMLYVASGYGKVIGHPGNALLAFGVDGARLP